MKLSNIFSRKKPQPSTNTDQRNFQVYFKETFNFDTYKNLFDHHPDAVFTLDLNGYPISINKNVTNLFGYLLKDLTINYQEYIYPDHRASAKYNFQKALQGLTGNFKTIVFHKNGDLIDVYVTYLPIIVDHNVVGVYGIAKDIRPLVQKENEIKNIQNNFIAAQRIANIGSWEYDIQKDECYWSDQVYSIFQVKDRTNFIATYNTYKQFVHPDDLKRFGSTIKNAMKNRTDYAIEYQIIRTDGEQRIVYDRAEFSENTNGRIFLIGTIQDITEKKMLEEKVKEIDSQISNITSNLDVGLWSFDIKTNKVLYCSEGVNTIFCIPASSFMNNLSLKNDFIHPKDLKEVDEKQHEVLNGKKITHHYRIIDATGNTKWVEECSIPVFNNGEVIRIDGIIKDVTEHKLHEQKLEFLINHDYLTNLPNKRYLHRKLKKLIEDSKKSGSQFALFCIDLDRFKYVNDTLGHEVGDKLLQYVSKLLTNSLGDATFIARIGGDEFALILPNIRSIEACVMDAKKVIDLIEQPIFIYEYEILITTSIGISFYPYDGLNEEVLLNKANVALKKVKELGSNDIQVYSPSLNIESFKSYELERDLRKALINNEFFFEYQPKVDIKTGRIMGAEALIRWCHQDWGRVSPADLMPLTEEIGLIFKLGDWGFRKVCAQIAKWRDQGMDLVPISVNISPKRLLKANFIENIVSAIEEYQIDPKLIDIELTETAFIKNFAGLKPIIEKLRAYGVAFSLDDFGTGFSSLTYLKDLKVDKIKIDQSFIQEIGEKSSTEAIIKSIIYLAKELGIEVISEGVENNQQLNFLKQQECKTVQGYIFCKSLSTNDFFQVMKKRILKPNQSNSQDTLEKNRRKFYRINFKYPLKTLMTIIKFKGKEVNLGRSHILTEDISLGGLRFSSTIDLPVQPDIVLQFTMILLEQTIEVTGCIKWKQEWEGDILQYGIEFMLNEIERDKLASILNQLTLQLKKTPLLNSCNFVVESRKKYFRVSEVQ